MSFNDSTDVTSQVKETLSFLIRSNRKLQSIQSDNYLPLVQQYQFDFQLLELNDPNLKSNANPKSLSNITRSHTFQLKCVENDNNAGYNLEITLCFYPKFFVYISLLSGERDQFLEWPAPITGLKIQFRSSTGQLCPWSACLDTSSNEERANNLAKWGRPCSYKNVPFFRSNHLCTSKELFDFLKVPGLNVCIEISAKTVRLQTSNQIGHAMKIMDLSVIAASPNSFIINAYQDNTCYPNPYQTVFWPHLNPLANFFQVEILNIDEGRAAVGIGVSPRGYFGQNQMPGWNPLSVAYHSDDGKLFQGRGYGEEFGPVGQVGDLMGCGLLLKPARVNSDKIGVKELVAGDHLNAELFFTMNGVLIKEPVPLNTHKDQAGIELWDVLFPSVGLIGDKTVARFFKPTLFVPPGLK